MFIINSLSRLLLVMASANMNIDKVSKYLELTVIQLKAELKLRGCKVSGKKKDLIER